MRENKKVKYPYSWFHKTVRDENKIKMTSSGFKGSNYVNIH